MYTRVEGIRRNTCVCIYRYTHAYMHVPQMMSGLVRSRHRDRRTLFHLGGPCSLVLSCRRGPEARGHHQAGGRLNFGAFLQS